MDIKEKISYLYRSGSSAEDVECADTMEKLLAENELLRDQLIEHQDRDDALWLVYEAAKKEVDAFDGGYGVTVKHLRKVVAAVKP